MSIPELVAELCAASIEEQNVEQVRSTLTTVGRVQAWLDAVKLGCARRLDSLAPVAGRGVSRELAGGQRCTRRDAEATVARAGVLEVVPGFETALASGRVSGGHLDVLARAVRTLDEAQRTRLATAEPELLADAEAASPEVFAEQVRRHVRMLDDGVETLDGQRRAARVRMWLDPPSGMYRLSGELDPMSGMALRNRFDATIRSLTAAGDPDTCPTDPREKLDHLRALALVELMGGAGGRGPATRGEDDLVLVGSNYDLSIVIDAQTLCGGWHPASRVDVGDPDIELPLATVQRLACLADLTGVALGDKGVPLKLGRTTRLASRAQRRALRTMYPTCAMPGCTVPSRFCQPHHVQWWRDDGLTDLENLLPVCSRHHRAVHEGGWKLALRRDHSYAVTYPDGDRETIPPPAKRRPRRARGHTAPADRPPPVSAG
jgi:Domain of unknown function (DUF222)